MDFSNTEEQLDLLLKNTTQVFGLEQLEKKLGSGKRLNIKLGVDPTAKDVTLGWAVVLRKLRDFQQLGHTACLVIGDFTATIGDPTGKSKTRKQLTAEEIKDNINSLKKSLFKILCPTKTKIFFNKDWLGTMSFEEVIHLCSQYTVARMLERDDFSNRLAQNIPISMHEMLYPLCQGMDSVHLNADVEIGGNDQMFNTLVGRNLMDQRGQEPQVVLLCPLLIGTDGKQKMSQSLNNYVSINDEPNDMFGKIMSIPDTLIENWFKLCTDVPVDYIHDILTPEKNPRDAKIILAKEIVGIYHGWDSAQKAELYFTEIFSKKEIPQDIPELLLPNQEVINLIDLIKLVEPSFSNTKARQYIRDGAVSLNFEKFNHLSNQTLVLNTATLDNSLFKVGKKKYVKLRFSSSG